MSTVTPEEDADFSESVRAAFDAEFDAQRERPEPVIVLLLCFGIGALAAAAWFGLGALVSYLCGRS